MSRQFHTVTLNHGELTNLLLAAATTPNLDRWTPAARGALKRALARLAEELDVEDVVVLALVREAEAAAACAEARDAVAGRGDRSMS